MIYNSPNPLLTLLLSAPVVSGEACARQMGISRAAVHKRVNKFRDQGWKIEASPKKGLSLLPPYPFALIPELIALKIPFPLLFAENISSTNTAAKEIAAQAPFVFMARAQFQGLGRAGRSWQVQPDKDLALSFAFKSSIPAGSLFAVIRLASLAVYEAVHALKAPCMIKWPNDLIDAEGRKVCGILTESLSVDHNAHTLIIGIGLNVNSSGLPDYAVSLKNLLGREIDINALAADIIIRLAALLEAFPQNERETAEAWAERLAWKGERVALENTGQKYEGIFLGCGADGSVLLNRDGVTQTFFSGDFSRVRLRKALPE